MTNYEKQMLESIIADYGKIGVMNTEFHNTFGIDAETNKKLRGAFTSLKRKKIVEHCNDKGCFNPIYPTNKMIAVCEENGIKIPDETLAEMKKYILF